MATVTITFNKAPTAKNLTNRSLSFQESEISLVKATDTVVINVTSAKFVQTTLTMQGSSFLKSLTTATKGSAKFSVYKY